MLLFVSSKIIPPPCTQGVLPSGRSASAVYDSLAVLVGKGTNKWGKYKTKPHFFCFRMRRTPSLCPIMGIFRARSANLFPRREYFVPSLGTLHSQRGNIYGVTSL